MAEINVLYAFDTRFWKLASVSMYSLLKNKKNTTSINIYCMVAPHTKGKKKIFSIIKKFPNTKLIWRPIKPYENPFRTYEYSRWSPVIFYRLFAHKIFPNVDKLLYLDSDTLICDDLTELYETNLSKYVIGAVQDLAPIEDPTNPNGTFAKGFSEQYLNNGPYFNSGVLLINTKRMKEFENALISVKAKLTYPDQDIMNVALLDRIKPLELKYNFAPNVKVPKHFPPKQAKEVIENKYKILHFYTVKPYYYLYISRDIYSRFYNTADEIDMHPEDFIKQENKHLKKYAKKNTKTNIPFLKLRRGTIYLFGIKILQI